MATNLISLRLPDVLLKALDSVSKNTERSRTFILRKALENYLEEYVDYQIALDRLNDKDDAIISSKELRSRIEV